MATRLCCLYVLLLLLALGSTMIQANNCLPDPSYCLPVPAPTLAKIEFSTNLLIYKTEYFLRGSIGRGINDISPGLVKGPIPVGVRVANLDKDTRKVIEELGLTGVGHLRAIVNWTKLNSPIPMPQLDLSPRVYGDYLNRIFNTSYPEFDIYANTTNFLIVANYASYLVQQYYAGIIPSIVGDVEKRLVAGIALNEAAGFGVIRDKLYGIVNSTVTPYTFTAGSSVDNFTFTVGDVISGAAQLLNQLGGCGVKDEGLIVPPQLGAENRTTTNVLPADVNSLTYPRYEREMSRIFFGTGDATKPGAIFPRGFTGALYKLILRLNLS